MPIDTYKSQKRGGKGITGISTREEDFVKQIFIASTHDTILFFSNRGKLYTLKGYEVPEAGRTAKGTAIVNLLRLDAGEKISAIIPIQNFADGKYLLMGTKNGFIKKTAKTPCCTYALIIRSVMPMYVRIREQKFLLAAWRTTRFDPCVTQRIITLISFMNRV